MDLSAITAYAAATATQLAAEYVDDPEGELDCWLAIASEREEMAAVVYDPDKLKIRMAQVKLGARSTKAALRDIEDAIRGIWSHEAAHTAYLAAVGRLRNKKVSWSRIASRVKGHIVAANASKSPVQQMTARIALALAVPFGAKVPKFVPMMRNLSFRALCMTNSALEETAVTAYERMIELCDLCRTKTGRYPFNIAFVGKLRQFLLDEQAHREIFRVIASEWMVADESLTDGLTSRKVLDRFEEILYGTCERPPQPYQRVGADATSLLAAASFGAGSRALLTHAGLADLFQRHKRALAILPESFAIEQLQPHRLI